jgi:hypothetical protein
MVGKANQTPVFWNRNKTTGNLTFFLSETGMHYGSGSGFGSESNIKWNKKVKKQNGGLLFLGNNSTNDCEKARFCTNIF